MKFETHLPSVLKEYLDSTPLQDFAHSIQSLDWKAVVFGGSLRDFVLSQHPPRDIDIVVKTGSIEKILPKLGRFAIGKTRFGGLRFEISGWIFDIWSLDETWAFKTGVAGPPAFEVLPRTTFLNAEAIAIDLFPGKDGKHRLFVQKCFYQALANKVVEVNLGENPFPDLSVVRALLTAARLDFAIGPRLRDYVLTYGRGMTGEYVKKIQLSHYGEVKWDPLEIVSWLSFIYSQSSRGDELIKLPLSKEKVRTLRKKWARRGHEKAILRPRTY